MSKSKVNLTDTELRDIIKKIAKPTFTYFIKRMQRELFTPKHRDLPMNYVATVLIESLSNATGNVMRWLDKFYFDTTGQNPGTTLRMEFFKSLQEHFNAGQKENEQPNRLEDKRPH